ncbi:MAG: type III-A CRISPR-associated RAMP protein Csm5 [Bacteroides sp.]|nr:type III-A CRISPR-associated RAMP protein Csm5 [Bacteroides sp.]MCM1548737.1 type III-A CRISPR-associated RAMP protein Csm5 [Clostridium sp.]
MNRFIRVFDVVLTTKGPVFIGSGQEIMKKEYIFQEKRKKVVIPRLDIMYADICSLHRQRELEEYMLSEKKISLGEWMEQQRIPESYISRWKRYELECGDILMKRNAPVQIMACVKDAYGNPYIPGSSLKGLLRTLLLTYDITCNPETYNRVKGEIKQRLNENEKPSRHILEREAKRVEETAFHKAERTEKKSDIVNDIMAGMMVSDSSPLSTENLILCPKLEYHTDGSERRLNLLRECIKPETEIHFELAIDTSICRITEIDIQNAVKNFASLYYEQFIKKFSNMEPPFEHTVWLGGGAGYVSKTVSYALFDKEAPKVVSAIFKNTGVPRKHQHDKDIQMGVSPHILKMTQYQGRKYQFGMCELQLKEKK